MQDYIQSALLVFLVVYLVGERRRGQSPLPVVSRPTKTRKVILDTCALIDGRILEVVKSGFMPEELVVPQFVIAELQLLADGRDSHKRERARYGLDVIRELQDSSQCEVVIDRTEVAGEETDEKLVHLSKLTGGLLYTTDYNLNKVADIEGVRVLNINELAQLLRPAVLPGEQRRVKIVQRGSNPHQGVGYMDDGTMIVVQDAAQKIGQSVPVEVTRSFQTLAGKMLFATIKSEQPAHDSKDRASELIPRQKRHRRPPTAKAVNQLN